MTLTKRSSFLMLLVAFLLLVLPVHTALADNTKDAHRVLSCSYTYDNTQYSSTMYVLDQENDKASRQNLESREQYFALWNVAGIYHHEYIDYPKYPTTVVPADLKNWSCTWHEGNTP